jgi:hypothetical protein
MHMELRLHPIIVEQRIVNIEQEDRVVRGQAVRDDYDENEVADGEGDLQGRQCQQADQIFGVASASNQSRVERSDHAIMARAISHIAAIRGDGQSPWAVRAHRLNPANTATIGRYTERFDNTTRRHSALAFRSPIRYEMMALYAAQDF